MTTRRSRRLATAAGLAALVSLAGAPPVAAQPAAPRVPSTSPGPLADPIASYFAALEAMKLVDPDSGSLESLREELQRAERLLRDGAFPSAAVALHAIVKSPRYRAFGEFVEFQNAEYDLAVALARSGSQGAALEILEQTLARGPSAPYWGPAHRRAVDIALETRDHAGVLARIEAVQLAEPIPPSAAGERAYLQGRAAYERGKLADADRSLERIPRSSRLYSSAVYLRGVIRARQGQYQDAAEAMCQVAGTADDDTLTFVVDDRYFTIKDLARLGLGRIAHERGEYDDAYYHYFQIPEDSTYLPDALFEAAWSMYQKRELSTSRDLVRELLTAFPTSPLWPEASLLAGYVELADCEFDASQARYDALVAKLRPIVAELDALRRDPDARGRLFDRALTRYREVKQTGQVAGAAAAATPREEVLALVRIDPKFLRLHDAVTGAKELAHLAPQLVRQWQNLARQVAQTRVAAVSGPTTPEQEQLADANAVVEDLRRLAEQVAAQRRELARARREQRMPGPDADAELDRLAALSRKLDAALASALAVADRASAAVTDAAHASIRPMIQADVAEARRLDRAAHALAARLSEAGERLAQTSIDRLHADTRKVLDKARLGTIDAVIGQKRKLDIAVQDLAAGRLPEELFGRMWNASMIADDEEYWPFEGEYWADEYSGWR